MTRLTTRRRNHSPMNQTVTRARNHSSMGLTVTRTRSQSVMNQTVTMARNPGTTPNPRCHNSTRLATFVGNTCTGHHPRGTTRPATWAASPGASRAKSQTASQAASCPATLSRTNDETRPSRTLTLASIQTRPLPRRPNLLASPARPTWRPRPDVSLVLQEPRARCW